MDDEAFHRTTTNIIEDILAQPGQAGLDETHKRAASMEMLALTVAGVVFVVGNDPSSKRRLSQKLLERVERHLESMQVNLDKMGTKGGGLAAMFEAVFKTPEVTSVKSPIVCPHCETALDLATAASGFGRNTPEDGDATLCMHCGGFAVFDSKATGQARKATKAEDREMGADPMVQAAQRMWAEIKGKAP